ncbi:MAG: Ig-like domain-containing protein [Bacteroidales bacterium]|nr:Ig-like domain-containing protein [Bacteroidales bacterium]
MKRFFKALVERYLPAIPIGVVLGFMFFSHSCANTTTPPSGGPKATIPPVLVKVMPFPNTTLVDTHKTRLVFTFNEYVVVKDASSIFLSPPQEKRPQYRINNKSVVVYFDKDLDSNKTYTLDLTNAIADNNEGNMFIGYTLAFSTGPELDSMLVTGSVYDCNTQLPVKGATVMLYKFAGDSTQINDTTIVPTDSLIFLRRPDAAVRTDEWGFFCLRNIADTVYRMYAVLEESPNNIYDPDNDKVAFIDSLVRPTHTVGDSLKEMLKYDMEDTVACLARNSDFELNLFKETPTKQLVKSYERIGERTAYVTFMAPYAQIDSIWIQGVPREKLITQFNATCDSLEIWVNDPNEQPDTLFLNIDYMKTDSTGILSPFVEEIKLSKPRQTAMQKMQQKKDIKKEDTTTVFTVMSDSKYVEQYGIRIEFKFPLIESAFDSLVYRYINPRQQEAFGTYKVKQDTLNLRLYTVTPDSPFQIGYDYYLKIPQHKFMDINGFYNDSLEVKITLPSDDKMSKLSLVLTGVKSKYIVDLLGEKRDKVLREYIIDSDCTLPFPYLSAGKYCIRLTEDKNRNGLVDTGNLLEHRQPEKVKFYKLSDGTFLLNIPEAMEITQDIDVAKLFEDD